MRLQRRLNATPHWATPRYKHAASCAKRRGLSR